MPMKPHAGEDQSDFMSRCVPEMMGDGKREQDQAVAICLDIWRSKSVDTKDHGPPREGESRADFMSRCMAYEDMDETACATMWEQHQPGKPEGKSAEAPDRAWSMLTVKGINAEQREIHGVATTPQTDRVGDVVNPMGANFTLPMPLLHHHKHDAPVGNVVRAQANKDGISITARLAKVTESGALKERVDLAWQEIKAGLIKGLSIGFSPIDFAPIDMKNPLGGLRFDKWNWYELSLVTIPANTGATIQLIKSLDIGLPATSGEKKSGVKISKAKKGIKIDPTEVGKEITFHMSRSQIAAFQMINPDWKMKRCERSHLLYQDGDPLFACTFVANI